jgi:hypothetical protein
MPKHSDAPSHAENHWHSGRPSGSAASDATDAMYGVAKPDVIGDFLRERALDGLIDDRDGDCPCGSGESYGECHGKPAES